MNIYSDIQIRKRHGMGRKTLLNYILIFLLVLVEYKYFCLPSNLNAFFVKYNVGSNQQIKILIALALIVFNIKHITSVLHNKIVKTILCLATLLLLSAFISGIQYGYLDQMFYKLINLLYLPICTIALVIYTEKIHNILFLIKILTIINIIACAIFSIQTVVYDNTKQLFLTILWSGDGVYMRDGSIRIIECLNMVSLSFALSLCELINDRHRKDKFLNFVNVVLSAVYIFFAKTRSVQLLCIIIATVIFFVGYKANTKWKFFVKTAILIIAITVLVNGLYIEVMDSLSISVGEKSYVARAGAFLYYISIFKDNIISGLGFVDFDGSPYWSLVHGSYGLFYPSDVGLIGTTAYYGVLVGIWYLMVIIGSVKNWLSNKKCILLLVLMIILLYTSITLSMLDNGRFTVFALIMLLEEKGYIYSYIPTKSTIKIKLK